MTRDKVLKELAGRLNDVSFSKAVMFGELVVACKLMLRLSFALLFLIVTSCVCVVPASISSMLKEIVTSPWLNAAEKEIAKLNASARLKAKANKPSKTALFFVQSIFQFGFHSLVTTLFKFFADFFSFKTSKIGQEK
jgi:hypothetical protein